MHDTFDRATSRILLSHGTTAFGTLTHFIPSQCIQGCKCGAAREHLSSIVLASEITPECAGIRLSVLVLLLPTPSSHSSTRNFPGWLSGQATLTQPLSLLVGFRCSFSSTLS